MNIYKHKRRFQKWRWDRLVEKAASIQLDYQIGLIERGRTESVGEKIDLCGLYLSAARVSRLRAV